MYFPVDACMDRLNLSPLAISLLGLVTFNGAPDVVLGPLIHDHRFWNHYCNSSKCGSTLPC